MISSDKLTANRANSLRSTGPKSQPGKQTASRNATRHGLTGKQVVIQGEDPAAYEALRTDLIEAYAPANAAETMLVDEIAQCFWRLQRARALEAEAFLMLSGGADPIIPFNAESARFDNIRRYMTTIERAYHRAMQQLEKTQALRVKQQSVGFVSQKKSASLTRVAKPLPNHGHQGSAVSELRPAGVPGTTFNRATLETHKLKETNSE